VRPVTRENFDDFAALFEARGGPHYCWCTSYRFRDVGELSDAQKKDRMQGLAARAVPIGVLAYAGDTPVGWCSIAPRESCMRLEKSRTMPRVTPAGTPTWVVLCFFVHSDRRGQGVPGALLSGAVAYARGQGARVIEGYPADTAGISSTHRGHSRVFKAAGFHPDGKRWFLAL
jgi:GNAT superfamily N-acetyltransferase